MSEMNLSKEKNSNESAIMAGGCFWCLEAVFKRLKGIHSVKSGYIGGKIKNPTYKEVCSGLTGHAEAVKIEYDPEMISFEILLNVFFSMHDPTTLNRQGADIGTQYRSEIFYVNQEQAREASDFIKVLERDGIFSNPVVTRISPASEFYEAEAYHDDYYDLNREKNSYCTAVIDPKINKLRKSFAAFLK
jgi:peptide-methionine (S)-S-oxide reductase